MFIYHNFKVKVLLISIFFILVNCKLQEPTKTHGIMFLENRANKLTINQSNKNDIVKIMGYPQIVEEEQDQTWIYIERILSKGKYHKLGQHVLKTNNVLILEFDKYGVLTNKQIYNKEKIKNIKFSENETENTLSQKSFAGKFLQSIKQKMYGSRKK